ncbi:hypothetical protein, partial [Kitasatospora sp. NPDC094011]|uniref:hypothetical protein n=1 Tax=Kitasatospora sp. NPDC094011 TaxID=3364090 RepID=UPI003811554A
SWPRPSPAAATTRAEIAQVDACRRTQPTHHTPNQEVNTMIDIQDIEVMAEALTCGSYNKG